MKKGIVAILVILALVVIVSPGIVGKLAEQSVDEQLQWAAEENQEVVITSQKFDRGWFSSEGQHRIELGNTGPGAHLREALDLGPDEPIPALIIDTRLDHGLIPVSSVTREEGSLAPGLGRAASTVSIEYPDGSVSEIPGVIYSNVGLDGGLTSHYFLEPGTYGETSWGAADVEVSADARAGHVIVDGGIDSLSFTGEQQSTFTMSAAELSADMTMTEYGYSVGDMAFAIDAVNVESPGSNVAMGPINVNATSELDGDRVDTSMTMDFAMAGVPPVGDIAWTMDVVLNDLDAAAAGRLQRAIESAQGVDDPMQLMPMLEDDLKDLVAAGAELRFDKLNITLPQGTLLTKLAFTFPETDRQTFNWTGVLLDMVASAEITVPESLYELATAMNPQVNAAVAMGFLKKNGDVYEMAAEYKQGLLTVNGAPMPIPLPGS